MTNECLTVGTGAQYTKSEKSRRTSIDHNRRETARTTSRGRSDASDLDTIIRPQSRLLEELVEHQRKIQEDARDYGLEVTKRIDIARRFQLDADRKRKEHYDRSHHQVEFLPGSLVLLHRPVLSPGLATKMQNKFTGPYRVACRLSDVTYELQNLDTQRPVLTHVQRIVPYFLPELVDANGHARVALNSTPHDGGCVTMDLGSTRRARSTSPVEIERRVKRRLSCPELTACQDEWTSGSSMELLFPTPNSQ